MVATFTVKNAEVVIKNLNRISDGVSGAGLTKPMRQATLLVTRDAKKLSPVDTGTLRSSIAPEIRAHGDTIEGIVGTPVKYAPYMELGTKAHFPPISALQVWARRHGMSAFIVARAISRRGLKPRKFLQSAFDNNASNIQQIFDDYVKKTVE